MRLLKGSTLLDQHRWAEKIYYYSGTSERKITKSMCALNEGEET
ncbi:MAG: hypothetical protein QW424_06135 [Candidatus Bathyarchaeia archaeon]